MIANTDLDMITRGMASRECDRWCEYLSENHGGRMYWPAPALETH